MAKIPNIALLRDVATTWHPLSLRTAGSDLIGNTTGSKAVSLAVTSIVFKGYNHEYWMDNSR